MLTTDFLNFVKKVQSATVNEGIYLDTMQTLRIADALYVAPGTPDYSTHEGRVQAALASPEVMNYMREIKKIYAIKTLRNITMCGLKEAKEAVEDQRVIDASGYATPYDY